MVRFTSSSARELSRLRSRDDHAHLHPRGGKARDPVSSTNKGTSVVVTRDNAIKCTIIRRCRPSRLMPGDGDQAHRTLRRLRRLRNRAIHPQRKWSTMHRTATATATPTHITHLPCLTVSHDLYLSNLVVLNSFRLPRTLPRMIAGCPSTAIYTT